MKTQRRAIRPEKTPTLAARTDKKQAAYSEIALDIRNDIHRGKYSAGQRMPTLVEMAKKYRVSGSTVCLAFRKLATDGLLLVEQGRGTFVAPPKRPYNPARTFAEQFDGLGLATRTELVDTRWYDPHRDAASFLAVPAGEQVWSVCVLHHLDDVACMMEVIDLPRRVAEGLVGDSHKARALYSTLRDELGYEDLVFHVRRIDIMSERYYDELHGTPFGTPFYEIRRAVCCSREPLAMSYAALRSDKFHLDMVGSGREREEAGREIAARNHSSWRKQIHERFVKLTS